METGRGGTERNPATPTYTVTKRRDWQQCASLSAGEREPDQCYGLQTQVEGDRDLIRDCGIVALLAWPLSNDHTDDVLNRKGGAEVEKV
jgi:hypothetical protein